jgi:molybdenum cofactor cytidylyltransferase
MERDEIAAIVLAAGSSSRMRDLKPLLPIGGVTIVERAVRLFQCAGVRDVHVVVGHRRELLAPVLERLEVRVVVNDGHAAGMFSSVLAGLDRLEANVRAFFLLPADVPLVRPWTVGYLLQSLVRHEGKILYPCFHGKRGHPPLIPSGLIPWIRGWRGADGLRGALARLEDRAVAVHVADGNILHDADTPEQYEDLLEKWERYTVPSRDECEAILGDVCGVDGSTVAHCRAVAAVAGTMADELNRAGCPLDKDVIIAAALLHDLAKGKPGHAGESARLVDEMGYPDVARAIASHMDIEFEQDGTIGEKEVVYLADKLVEGDRAVCLAERFARRHGGGFEAGEGIKRRQRSSVLIKDAIERRIGKGWIERHVRVGGIPSGDVTEL